MYIAVTYNKKNKEFNNRQFNSTTKEDVVKYLQRMEEEIIINIIDL